jgi:mannose-6-phosphate isomerase-like protein (cupin superfamily)
VTRLITAAAALAALVLAAPLALAQDKAQKKAAQVSLHQITENDKVKVFEATYKPGAENKGVATSTMRVVRAIRGGALQRIYADGKTETIEWKPGQVRIVQPGPAYTTKNVGKSVLVLYVVQLK